MLSVGLRYRKAAALPPSYHQFLGTPSIIVPIAVCRYMFQCTCTELSHSHSNLGTAPRSGQAYYYRVTGGSTVVRDALQIRVHARLAAVHIY